MTKLEAIEIRSSRRRYLPTEMTAAQIEVLEQEIARFEGEAGVLMELIQDCAVAFQGFRKSYGLLSGVRDCICLFAPRGDQIATEKLGYFGEDLVLTATALGLGTCWVGGTFSKGDIPYTQRDGQEMVCAIAIGNVAQAGSLRERFIQKMTHRKTKTVAQMSSHDAPPPDWFDRGMQAVLRAPSAVNRQPVHFTYESGAVHARISEGADVMTLLDFGIAKLHFELAAGSGAWDFGNGARFVKA